MTWSCSDIIGKKADRIKAKGEKVVFVQMKKPEIPTPKSELMSASPHWFIFSLTQKTQVTQQTQSTQVTQ
jgi:hypothetical protein